MKLVGVLIKRELGEMISSPIYYVIMALFSFLIGITFFNSLVSQQEITNFSLNSQILLPTFGTMNFLLIFVSGPLTMNLFVDEERNHTMDLLFLARPTLWQIIWAKFLVGVLMTFGVVLPSLIFPFILWLSGPIDLGLVIINYLSLIGMTCCFVSVGLFASSVTKNALLSAILSSGILLSLLILLNSSLVIKNELVKQILQYTSFAYHAHLLSQGGLSSHHLIYFITFCCFFLYLTARAIEVRRCK